MGIVSDSRDIDTAVANMLVTTVKMRHPSWGSSFHSKHIGTLMVEGVDGNNLALKDGLVLRLRHERFHSVPSMVPHCKEGVVAAFCQNWRSYNAQLKSWNHLWLLMIRFK